MALTAQQREDGWQWFSRHRHPIPESVPARFSKDELRAALDATVAWIEANQGSYAASLAGTVFAGANSTTDEKLRLFLTGLSVRFGISVG